MKSILVTMILLAPFAVPAVAHSSCDDRQTVWVGPWPHTLFYIDYLPPEQHANGRMHGPEMWVYQETNGEPGPQRGGSSPYIPDDNEICVEDPTVAPDTLIF